ncbi:hypothetical protein ACGFIJ_18160 [Microbispora bryophytorum]|uniref:hypothetical protein n=1 Tax=Microbispora bryophytorum TaxID=1460882 RepID=UPI00371E6861
MLMWSAAAAVTCAAVGLSGSIAANATTTKIAPAAHAATTPQGGGEKQKFIPFPRLDATNIVTNFTFAAGATTIAPTATRTFTGSARRGNVFVNDGNSWVNVTPVFGTGYYYDIALAASPSTAVPAGATGIAFPATGAGAGQVRVTVRRADGAILRSDCTVSSLSGAGTIGAFQPLTTANCTAPQTL